MNGSFRQASSPGGSFNPMLSVTSLSSSRGGGGTPDPSPKCRYHGDGPSPRRFSSRHVPTAAEELASRTEVLSASASNQFTGLMKYLKKNSEWEEQQKRVMASDMEAFIPEDFDETLRAEFERRVSFGERLNTELMTSAKWVKVLRDIKVIVEPSKSGSQTSGKGRLTLADADIIFKKVLHNCDHGGKKLTYDLFCKALCLASKVARPDLEDEHALHELVARVAAVAPPDLLKMPEEPDYTLDPSVVMELDHFKPALQDLFDTFCTWNLSNPAEASRGTGAVRLAERTAWRQSTSSTLGASGLGGTTMASCFGSPRRSLNDGLDGARHLSRSPQSGSSEADAGGGLEGPLEQNEFGMAHSPSRHHHGDSSLPTLFESRYESPIRGSSPTRAGTISGSVAGSMFLSSSPRSRDPYVYANGAPVVRDRHRVLSLDQFLSMNRELKVMPEFLSRLEIVRIFKRVQTPGGTSTRGGSAYGHIAFDAFVDAIGQVAFQAYTKEPYCDEFPTAHERIRGFLLRFLPRSSKAMHESFNGRHSVLFGNGGESPKKLLVK
mmetsp:Transcript_9378/g.24253  ORF Transcript_9378/g.24253 Transcript_9378/m.24253 type:complete len:551 (-) Transcript_9378:71-1723(-)